MSKSAIGPGAKYGRLTVRASILTCTARSNPQWRWMADSIARQTPALLSDVEWVVVDAKLWDDPASRRQELAAAARPLLALGAGLVHIQPKPCAWQGPNRLTRGQFFALSNARNTGLVVARGERIIALDDCSVVADDWLAGHLRYPPTALVAGSFFTYRTAKVVDGVVVEGDPGPYGLDSRVAIEPEPCRTNAGWLYGLSCSYPLEAALRVNGADEKYDSQAGGEDCDQAIRMERAGYAAYWDPRIRIFQILESHEPVFETSAWNMNQPVRRTPKELVVRRDQASHFANEVLAERLVLDDIDRYLPLGNPFDLREMRAHYKATGQMLPHPFESDVDWRDGQPLAEME